MLPLPDNSFGAAPAPSLPPEAVSSFTPNTVMTTAVSGGCYKQLPVLCLGPVT